MLLLITFGEGTQLITAVGVLASAITSIIGVFVGLRTSRHLAVVHEAVNGQTEALLNATAEAKHAEGKAEGIAEERANGSAS